MEEQPCTETQKPTVNLAQTSPVLCNSIRRSRTRTPLRLESTSPFNSVDIVLCPFSATQNPAPRQQRDRCNLSAKCLAHRHTGRERHLVALRGAEITLARKPKERVRRTYQAGVGGGGSRGAFCEEVPCLCGLEPADALT